MNSRPLVSVVMSVFNTEVDFLAVAVQSILNQTYDNFEVIIINDCSSDSDTLDYLKTIEDPRVTVLSNERNMGLAFSLNKAIEVANGDYIARMDTDDISLPDRLIKQVDYLEKNKNIDVLGTRAKIFGDDNGIRASISSSSDAITANFLFNVGITHPSIMIRKSFLDNNNCKYDINYRKSQDYKLWCDIADKGGRFYELPEALLKYRISPSQASAKSNNIDQKKNAREIRTNRVRRLAVNPSDPEIVIHNCLSENYYEDGLFTFDELMEWERKIQSANKKLQIYDNTSLKLVMTYNTLSFLRKNKQILNKVHISSLVKYLISIHFYLLYPPFHKLFLAKGR